MKNLRKGNDFKFILDLPKEAQPVVGMCEFGKVVILATSKSLYALGKPDDVEDFVNNFALRGVVADQKEQEVKTNPPVKDLRTGK